MMLQLGLAEGKLLIPQTPSNKSLELPQRGCSLTNLLQFHRRQLMYKCIDLDQSTAAGIVSLYRNSSSRDYWKDCSS